MAATSTSPTVPASGHADSPVVVNVNTAKQGGIASSFWRGVLINMAASVGWSWFAYLMASSGIIPYVLAFCLYLCGWTTNPPIPPGKQPPPAAVDPRFDELKLRLDDADARIKEMERGLQEERDRSASQGADIERLRGENATLVASVDRLEVQGQEARTRAPNIESQFRQERDEHEAHRRDKQWLRLALLNVALSEEAGIWVAMKNQNSISHINAQCTECHTTLWLDYPQKHDDIRCKGCKSSISAVQAWCLGAPPMSEWGKVKRLMSQ